MGTGYGPSQQWIAYNNDGRTNIANRIIKDGLVLQVDAGVAASYPGSGSIWYDLSGNNNNMTLVNSPTFSSTLGTLTFDGVTQVAYTTLNLASGTSTVMAGIRPTGTVKGRMISTRVNNWLLGIYGGNGMGYFYAEGWVYSSPRTFVTTWQFVTGTCNTINDIYEYYENDALYARNNAGSQGPNGLQIGGFGSNPSERASCEISFLLAYNRVLSQSEVSYNYKTLRRRILI